MEEKVNNITINLTSLVDYIRDKDVLIDGLRFTLDKYKTTIDKIKEYIKENANANVDYILELLEEIE
jgi:hypothetical protein